MMGEDTDLWPFTNSYLRPLVCNVSQRKRVGFDSCYCLFLHPLTFYREPSINKKRTATTMMAKMMNKGKLKLKKRKRKA